MEKLSEIMDRQSEKVLKITSGVQWTSSTEKTVDEPEYECSTCKDIGWLRVEDGSRIPKLITCKCQEKRIAQERKERMHALSGVPINHKTVDFGWEDSEVSKACGNVPVFEKPFDASHPKNLEMVKACYDWAYDIESQEPSTVWLAILGERGNGKTRMAYAIVNLFCDLGHKALYCYVPDLLDDLREAYKSDQFGEKMRGLKDENILVLDDIGAEKASDWSDEVLTKILDYRYRHEKNTVIIANTKLEGLPSRIADRLRDKAICKVIINTAPSYRPKNNPKG